ncbi:MAG: cell envelope integrity protein CreD [Schleiferiaceae bacterium]|jgi:inner membrane protein|nr:cell envelope integrity protein CreD [Schleiferiaceae bacterium]MDP4767692.1 cell envelope integrity protein CreD [Schleiferiaceae bacterium]MDP4959405.1 cell envelope integrity protein CreD [Schleiferiaceae bacterium]
MKLIQKPMFKMLSVAVLALLLLIPAGLIQNLIREREYTQENAINEMTSVWGGEQMLVGPYLTVPFDAPYTVTNSDGTEEISYARNYLYVLPEFLNGAVDVQPETRKLGIYEAVVYRGEANMQGEFKLPDWTKAGVDPKYIHWDKVTLNVGISDLRGVEGAFDFEWNEASLPLSSGLVTNDIYWSGVHSPVAIESQEELRFKFSTTLRGSRRFSVVPLGKQTTFSMVSPWAEPNFEGSFATTKYEPTAEGFSAHWEVSHLNRNYPQSWVGKKYTPANDFFGTEFIKTVDNYSKSTRVAKYAILIIALTFMVFYFSELMKGAKVNALQYVLVGLALVLFYTLLLSFSEHIGFNAAYLVAALMTVLMEFFYARSVLGSTKLAAYVAATLTLLYSFIFILIQLKDFALLAGSLGLFVILAGIMFISRRIQWEEE